MLVIVDSPRKLSAFLLQTERLFWFLLSLILSLGCKFKYYSKTCFQHFFIIRRCLYVFRYRRENVTSFSKKPLNLLHLRTYFVSQFFELFTAFAQIFCLLSMKQETLSKAILKKGNFAQKNEVMRTCRIILRVE